ncbi:MAG: tetratricopeptide repeat protein [Pirellula sp.]
MKSITVALIFISLYGCTRRTENESATVAPSTQVPLAELSVKSSESLQAADPVSESPVAVLTSQTASSEALTLRQEAQRLADELVKRVPNNPDALEVKARFHLLFGESESAKQCWLQAIHLVPNYAYALQGLGKVSMLHSDYLQAIVYLKQSLLSQPANVEAIHDLADSYTRLGSIDDAISTLETIAKPIAEKSPPSAQTLVRLGQSYLAKNRYEQAESVFRQAIQLSPGKTRAEQGLGTALLRMGRQDEARLLLAGQQAVRDSANKILTEQEQLEEEKRECSPRFRMVAEVYLGTGDVVHAEQIASRAVALDPTSAEARTLLFSIYQKQGKTKQAIDLARESQSLSPSNPDWHFTLGILLFQNGEFVAAEAPFREVIRLTPKNPVGYQSLARLLLRNGKNLKEAIPVAEKLVEVRGNAADHELLAQAYAVNSDLERAFQSLSQAIRLDPDNKDYAEAMRQLRTAMGTSNAKNYQ